MNTIRIEIGHASQADTLASAMGISNHRVERDSKSGWLYLCGLVDVPQLIEDAPKSGMIMNDGSEVPDHDMIQVDNYQTSFRVDVRSMSALSELDVKDHIQKKYEVTRIEKTHTQMVLAPCCRVKGWGE